MASGSAGLEWIREPRASHAVVVFVHGILSHGESAWTHPNGANWPSMLAQEPQFSDVGIGVFSYRADAFARNYSQSDAADFLRETIEGEGLLEKSCLIFVCHSLGGIVVRRFLLANQRLFSERNPKIGLFLVASPSLGSEDANRFLFLARMLESTQAVALRFSQKNVWLNDLDRDFQNLKEGGGLRVYGKELVEDEPFAIRSWVGSVRRLFGLREQLVESFSAARYFVNPVKIPYSNHNSIAKPESRKAIQHRILIRFVEYTISAYSGSLMPVKPESGNALSALKKLSDRLQQGKLVEYDALAAIQEALLETRSYLARLAKQQGRDSETENLLSEVWVKAGNIIQPYDPELAALCYVKGHGWADSDVWEKPEYKALPLAVDKMLERTLDATRRASDSAKTLETATGTNIVEGTLTVDTLTWRTTVLLPPFSAPPQVTVLRRDGRASEEPKIEGITPDKFTVHISNNQQAGEWVWRARGILLGATETRLAS
jgi:hypothetical protein